MNRSLRNLALLGLLALGASTAVAQSNVLFNVTYDPTSLRLTFTPTGNAVTWSGGSSGNVINSTIGAGIYFENFFSATPPTTQNGEFARTSVLDGLQGAVLSGSNLVSNGSSPLNAGFEDGGVALNLASSSNTSQALNFTYGQAAFMPQSLVIEFATDVEAKMKTAPSFSGGSVSVFASTLANPLGDTYVLGTYTYSAVPEPSTYAAIAGALGLGYAVYRRRRQAAAAATA